MLLLKDTAAVHRPRWSAADKLEVVVKLAIAIAVATRHIAVEVMPSGGVRRRFLRYALHVTHRRVACTTATEITTFLSTELSPPHKY